MRLASRIVIVTGAVQSISEAINKLDLLSKIRPSVHVYEARKFILNRKISLKQSSLLSQMHDQHCPA